MAARPQTSCAIDLLLVPARDPADGPTSAILQVAELDRDDPAAVEKESALADQAKAVQGFAPGDPVRAAAFVPIGPAVVVREFDRIDREEAGAPTDPEEEIGPAAVAKESDLIDREEAGVPTGPAVAVREFAPIDLAEAIGPGDRIVPAKAVAAFDPIGLDARIVPGDPAAVIGPTIVPTVSVIGFDGTIGDDDIETMCGAIGDATGIAAAIGTSAHGGIAIRTFIGVGPQISIIGAMQPGQWS